eukprot:1005364-Pleurochrysis_carterae.AAC.1
MKLPMSLLDRHGLLSSGAKAGNSHTSNSSGMSAIATRNEAKEILHVYQKEEQTETAGTCLSATTDSVFTADHESPVASTIFEATTVVHACETEESHLSPELELHCFPHNAFFELTVRQLKEMCRQKKLPVNGDKQALVQRLMAAHISCAEKD